MRGGMVVPGCGMRGVCMGCLVVPCDLACEEAGGDVSLCKLF